MTTTINNVQEHWNAHPCQSNLSNANDRRRYFEEISLNRYGRREWHVPVVGRFDSFRDRDVLEIGCGIATDGFEFARNGARYVGVDLTPHSIELARERFRLFGIHGRFEVVNAEKRLPFDDASFEHVYSFGVLHHSPHPERIAREIHRVLRKGGTFTVMLYNRTSINYYIEIMFLRKIFRWCLLSRVMPGLVAAITGFDRWKLEGHREALIGNGNISKEQWVSMNTDGPFCPLARVYNRNEAAALFSMFGDVSQEVWEFNVDHWPFVRRLIAESVARRIGRLWGWHRMINGTKT